MQNMLTRTDVLKLMTLHADKTNKINTNDFTKKVDKKHTNKNPYSFNLKAHLSKTQQETEQDKRIKQMLEKAERNKYKRQVLLKLHYSQQESNEASVAQKIKDLISQHQELYQQSYQALIQDLEQQDKSWRSNFQKRKQTRSLSRFSVRKSRNNLQFQKTNRSKENDFQDLQQSINQQSCDTSFDSSNIFNNSFFNLEQIQPARQISIDSEHFSPRYSHQQLNLFQNSSKQDLLMKQNRQKRKCRNSVIHLSVGSEADISGGFCFQVNKKELDKQIQQLMESWIEQKMQKINEVINKYDQQIKEYEMQKKPNSCNFLNLENDLILKVIQHMKVSQENEVQKIKNEMDEQMKKQLQELKKQFYEDLL